MTIDRARSLAVFFLAIAFPGLVAADTALHPSDLSGGHILEGSTSPDGKLCCIEAHIGPYTSNAIDLASTDRSKVLADTPLATEYSTDRPYKGRITIVWSPDSSQVAMHDAISKNSTLSILRAAGDSFEPVTMPDLLQAACQRWGIARSSIASSGQRPIRWSKDGILEVEVSAHLKSGGQRKLTLRLATPREGAPTVEAK